MKNSFLKICVLFLFSLNSLIVFSQNTLHYNDEKGSPEAGFEAVSWLTGNWKGASDFGKFEENWSVANGNSMLFSFKMWNDKEVIFYEIGHIIVKDKSLMMQIKHFDKDLKGWEKQEETEDFRLVKIEKNKVYFDNITYEKISDTEMNVYVLMEESGEELKFNFKK